MLPDPVFETKNGELFNADCLEILPRLEDESFDCIFADPPFNIGKDYGKKVNDRRKEQEYLDWTEAWLTECIRLLKEGGSLFVYNIPKWNIQAAHFLSKRLEFRHWITVDYKAAMPIPGKLYPSHYSLLYFTKGKPKKFNRPKLPIVHCRKCGTSIKDYGGYKKLIELNGGVNLSDVWIDVSPVRHAKYKNRQCNELPEIIVERVLNISTEHHDVILDPFGGSGTTYAVAEKMDRKWVGCEIEDCGYIIRRLSRLSESKIKNEIDKFATNFGSHVPEPGYIASRGWSS